jgi:hypothetical protein
MCGTRTSITVLHNQHDCSSRLLFLFTLRSILIFLFHLRLGLPDCLSDSDISNRKFVNNSLLPLTCYVPSLPHILYTTYSFLCTQLVEALRHKPKGLEFDSRWCHWIFHWYNTSGRTMTLGSTQPLTEMITRNIPWWGKGGRCLGRTTLPRSCIDYLAILEPQPPGKLRACRGL